MGACIHAYKHLSFFLFFNFVFFFFFFLFVLAASWYVRLLGVFTYSVSVCICTHSCLRNTAWLCVIQRELQSFNFIATQRVAGSQETPTKPATDLCSGWICCLDKQHHCQNSVCVCVFIHAQPLLFALTEARISHMSITM